jgi:integrase
MANKAFCLIEKHTRNDRPRMIPMNQEALAAMLELRNRRKPGARYMFTGRNGKRSEDVR